jgi:hypothetical protein
MSATIHRSARAFVEVGEAQHDFELSVAVDEIHNSPSADARADARLVEIVHLDSDAAAGADTSIRRRATVNTFAGDRPEVERASPTPLPRRATISIAQLFARPREVTASARYGLRADCLQRWPDCSFRGSGLSI